MMTQITETIQPIPTIYLGIAILAMLWPVWSDISGGAISQLGNYVPTGEERRGEDRRGGEQDGKYLILT